MVRIAKRERALRGVNTTDLQIKGELKLSFGGQAVFVSDMGDLTRIFRSRFPFWNRLLSAQAACDSKNANRIAHRGFHASYKFFFVHCSIRSSADSRFWIEFAVEKRM
jgi:hypothetical protein